MLFFFLGCSHLNQVNETAEPLSSKPMLKVGVSCNAPPLIFKEKGKITGLEADLATELAAFLGRKLQFIEVPWEKQFDYLDQGKTDIVMSGMSITSSRLYHAAFSSPYFRSGQIMLVRLDDYQKFSNGITSVMNTRYRIGTVENTTGDLLVTSTINDADKRTFKTSSAAVKALVANKIDVFIYDAPMICHYASLDYAEKLAPVLKMATEEYIGWAMRKDDYNLHNSVNEFLKTISTSGRLKQAINRRIPYLDR